MAAEFQCITCASTFPLTAQIYACSECGGLLQVASTPEPAPPEAWKTRFESRPATAPGPDGSGVWRYREWVLPDLPLESIVTLGEGNTPLMAASRLSHTWDVEVLVKQCGQSLSGSFKDLGMTVLISQVHWMRQNGHAIPAVACASTGDTSAALAAYGAAADIPTLVLLPAGKISGAQLVQPLSHGARVVAIDTDFDGCMAHVQRLCHEAGVYLANSKNSLRLEGQKTVAFEIAQGLGWNVPDWVVIPGGNLGNVSALVRGFEQLQTAGLTSRMPRVICAQAAAADPLFRAYQQQFAPLVPIQAQPTQASAIRIGNPVSFPRAVNALRKVDGRVASVSEQALGAVAREADAAGLYVCPHTAVALAAVKAERQAGTIEAGSQVVVVATAHGLKFTEFKNATVDDAIPRARLGSPRAPVYVADAYEAVRAAALDAAD